MAPSFADKLPAEAAFAVCFLAYQLLALLMGLGAALLLLPKAARRDTAALAPVFGVSVLVLAGWYMMVAGPPGTDRQWPWLVALGAVLTAAGCIARRRELRQAIDRDLPWLAACALAGVLLYAHGTLREPHLTAAAQNNDVTNYSNIERQLQDLPGDTSGGPSDQLGLVRFARLTVTGAFLPTATLASMLGVRTYQLQTVSIAAYIFWGALLAGVFAQRALGFARGGAMLVSLLAGAAHMTLYTGWSAFKSSLESTSVTLGLMVVVLPALGATRSGPALARGPAVALLGFALAATYPHMFPIVWVVLGGVAVAIAIAERGWGAFRDGAVILGGGLVVMIALSSERAWTTELYVFQMKAVKAGWPMGVVPLPALLGLSGNGPHWELPGERAGRIAAGLAAFALVAWGVRRALAEDRRAAAVAVGLLGILGMGYLVLWLTPGPVDEPGYKPFKLVSFFYPVVLACLLLSFRTLALRLATRADRARALGAAGMAAGALVLSAASSGQMRKYLPSPLADDADLQRLESDPGVESINIVTSVYWDAMWQAGFLMRKPLSLKYQTYYPASPRLEGKWDLERVPSEPPDEVLRREPVDPASLRPVNSTYVLRRREAVFSVAFGEGWSVPEPSHRWSTSQHATLLADTGVTRPVTLELRYAHLTPGNTFTVSLDGKAVGECPGPESCTVGPFTLLAGSHVLALEGALPPRAPGPADDRLLETAFTLIHLAPAPPARSP
jgi:hypothetical protein